MLSILFSSIYYY